MKEANQNDSRALWALLFLNPLAGMSQEGVPLAQTLRVDAPLKAGATTLWAPGMQGCWDSLRAYYEIEALKFSPASETADALNGFKWDPGSVLPEGFVAMAGLLGDGFVAKANLAIVDAYGDEAPLYKEEEWTGGPGEVGAVTYFERTLTFENKFLRSTVAPLPFTDSAGKEHEVEYFGSKGENNMDFHVQVAVLAYSANGYALEIVPKQAGEKVVLLWYPRATSFSEAGEMVRRLKADPLAGESAHLLERDVLKVPCFDIDSEEQFAAQFPGTFSVPGREPQVITKAKQRIQFQLDEEGARVRVRAPAGAEPFGPAPVVSKPRHFVFDKPFFVFLWREGAGWPYLALYVDSAAGLIPFRRGDR